MLYDPKWEQQTKPSLPSLAALVAWLEKQPAGTEYFFTDPTNCLLAQYLKAHGEENYCLVSYEADAFFHGPKDAFGHCRILRDEPRTFGAALERARAALAHS